MMQHGLLTEAKGLHANKELNALQTVGYRELFSYLNGEFSLQLLSKRSKKIQGALLSDKLPGSKR
jgi:tRNA dimethylallyltransferase